MTVNCFNPQQLFVKRFCPRIVPSLHSSARFEIEMDNKAKRTWFFSYRKRKRA